MNNHEQSVFNLIREGKVTQQDIARALPELGKHQRHEEKFKSQQSTLRQVRQIIHDLRTVHGKPILSDIDGYWISDSKEEAQEVVDRLEIAAKAYFKTAIKTYKAMKATYGIKSDYFDNQLNLF